MSSAATVLKSASKVVIALIGFTLGYLNDNMDVVPAEYRHYVTLAIGVATLLGVYQGSHGPLPSLFGDRRSVKRSAAKKRHPVSRVKHPAAPHPTAAVKSPGHTSVSPKDAG